MNDGQSRDPNPGSVQGNPASNRRLTSLDIPQLVNELELAVARTTTLAESPRAVRLLGSLCARLAGRLDLSHNRFSRVKTRLLLQSVLEHPDLQRDMNSGYSFVEMGCGGSNPFAGFAVLRALGAASCIGIDLDELDVGPALRALATTSMELIADVRLNCPFDIAPEVVRHNLRDLDITALEAGDLEAVSALSMEYRRCSASATGIEGRSVDYLTSNSFLEHVPDPDETIAEMARISRPGGLGVHSIDGVDHRSYGEEQVGPFEFLNIESDEALVYGCNRIRPLAFLERFERHGFEVRHVGTLRHHEVSDADRGLMVEPWRSMPTEQLETIGIRVFLRRR